MTKMKNNLSKIGRISCVASCCRDEEEDRVERLRMERERELAEMRRARALQMEMDSVREE